MLENTEGQTESEFDIDIFFIRTGIDHEVHIESLFNGS